MMLKQTANHSGLLKLNLQFFSEDEDMILPNDFETDTTPNEEITDQPEEMTSDNENTQQTERTQTEEQQIQESLQSLKVKFNKEEREIPIDEAIPLVQKGLNYDKVQERLQALESDPRLTLVEELAQQQGMDVNEFIEVVRKNQEEQQLNELIQQNIPEEYAREMLENRRFREQLQAEQQQKQQEEQQQQEFADFFKYFRDATGKDFNPESDVIPQSVWDANAQGVPLRYAFAEHENQQLRQQLATFQKNEENTKKSPVSGVTSHGSNENESEDPFLQGFNSI